jgi:hypothetical protein
MKSKITAVSIGAALVTIFLTAPVSRAADTEVFTAQLLGDNEVPPINSPGQASFRMEISSNGNITFTMTFSGLATTVMVSHLHFAPTKVGGGVMINLCGTPGLQACPAGPSGTFTGTITAANVAAIAGQGINAGDLTSALEAVREGNSYANIHTVRFPGGEIRGQVKRGKGSSDEQE